LAKEFTGDASSVMTTLSKLHFDCGSVTKGVGGGVNRGSGGGVNRGSGGNVGGSLMIAVEISLLKH